MQKPYSLTHDPTYYVAVGFFALLTTALPAFLGQPRFLPLNQAVLLTIFIAIPLSKGHLRGAFNVIALWLFLQFSLMTLFAWAFGDRIERAITDGFIYRGEIAAWFYSDGTLPRGMQAAPLARLAEIAGITLGSLLTAGLVGVWFLVRAVNLLGFSTGTLFSTLESPALLVWMLPIWAWIRVAGYAGLVILLAEPSVTRNGSFAFYRAHRQRPFLISLGLVIIGFLLELVLPGLMSRAG